MRREASRTRHAWWTLVGVEVAGVASEAQDWGLKLLRCAQRDIINHGQEETRRVNTVMSVSRQGW